MRIYLVGGAVRDLVMGIQPKDFDYVVVGSTPQKMLDYGYKQVGADFPVFLDESGTEYALARIERKTGVGYLGFECDASSTVTLEEDLARRDLTMNAMAIPYREDGNYDVADIIDPFNGKLDIENRCLRHVGEAFREDPVRFLRIARFAARYNFDVATETSILMGDMVDSGELDALDQQRVWKEISRGLMEPSPWVMFQVMDVRDAVHRKFSCYQGVLCGYGLYALSRNDLATLPLHVRFATIATYFITPEHYTNAKIPNECRDLAVIANVHSKDVADYMTMSNESKVKLITSLGGLGSRRNTTLFDDFITVTKVRQYHLYPYMVSQLKSLVRDREYLMTVDLTPVAKQAATIGANVKAAVNHHLITMLAK